MGRWQEAYGAALPALTPAAINRWQRECERAGGDCAARVEAVALRLPWARALRHGASLKIFTFAGELEFVDGLHGVQAHRYLGLIGPDGTHLVWQRRTTGVHFVGVSDCDGEDSAFDELPQALKPHKRPLSDLACTR
jgi:hypothetical protein